MAKEHGGSRSRRNIERLGSRGSSRGGKRNPNDSDSEDDDDIFSHREKRGSNVVVNLAKERKEKGPRDTKLYQDFCALCQDGGQLLCCDGPCLRAFHAECAGLKVLPEGDTWYCPDCTNKQHVCLHCNKVGFDADQDSTRFTEEKIAYFLVLAHDVVDFIIWNA